jgi:hypothetical protein
LTTTATNKNLIQEEIKRILNSGNACYHSVQNLLSSRLLPQKVKTRIDKTLILHVVLYGCEIWSLTFREEQVEIEVSLRPTVNRPVCHGVKRPSGTRSQFFLLLEISFRQLRVYYFVAPSPTRGRVCDLLYNCFRVLPEQSLLGSMSRIFYCFI